MAFPQTVTVPCTLLIHRNPGKAQVWKHTERSEDPKRKHWSSFFWKPVAKHQKKPRTLWTFYQGKHPSPLGNPCEPSPKIMEKTWKTHFLSQKVLLTSTASPLPFSSPELPPLQTGFEHGLCQSQQHCRENCSIALEPLITAMLRHSFKSCRNGNGIMQTEMRTHSNQSRVKTLNSQGQQ